MPMATNILVSAPHLELVDFATEMLVQHGGEFLYVAQGTGSLLKLHFLNAGLTKVVAAAVCQDGVLEHLETNRTGEVFRWALLEREVFDTPSPIPAVVITTFAAMVGALGAHRQ